MVSLAAEATGDDGQGVHRFGGRCLVAVGSVQVQRPVVTSEQKHATGEMAVFAGRVVAEHAVADDDIGAVPWLSASARILAYHFANIGEGVRVDVPNDVIFVT